MTKSKLLIVDDDTYVVDFVSNILIEEDYEILAAFNGQMAMDIVEKELPDLIILDWEMPVMDGIETIQRLKENPKSSKIPVIMITGRLNLIEDLKVAFDAGAIDFIHKPIEPVELVARTRSMLLLNKYYKESVKQKDWELTLMSTSIQQNDQLLLEVSDLFNEIADSLKQVDAEKYRAINSKLNLIKANLKNNSWEQFQMYFSNVHPDFVDNLLLAYPKITPEELKLCHYLKMNMSSKEIAAITNKEMHSIDIARYRLRKKFDLDRNVKFNEFLAQF